MLIFVQYLYGLTWAFSVAYARARLEACARTKREAVTHYVSRLNPRWPIPRVHLRTFSFSPEKPRGKRKYYSVDRDTCNIVTRLCRCSTDRNFSTCRYHVCEIVPCQRREGRKKREKSQVECVVRWTKATQRKLVDIYLGLEIIRFIESYLSVKVGIKGGLDNTPLSSLGFIVSKVFHRRTCGTRGRDFWRFKSIETVRRSLPSLAYRTRLINLLNRSIN